LKTGGPTRRPDASGIKHTGRPEEPRLLLRMGSVPSRTIGAMEAAFFDLDKTVVSKSSSLALSRPFYRAGLVTRSQLLRGVYAQLVYLMIGADEKRMDRAKDGLLALTRGWDREEVEAVVREALEEVVDPYIYQEALDLIELHRALGRRVYIVSSSPEEVVRPLAERLGVDDIVATRAESVNGKYTGRLEFYCYREQKAEAIRRLAGKEGIDLSGSYAYSDSVTDGPMLEAVGNPVAVNPDRELRRLAQQRGWKVRDFRRPVRLRHRLADVRRPTPVAVAVGAAMVAALLAWLYLRGRLARLQPAEARPGELRLVGGGKKIGSRRRKVPRKGAEPTLGLPREAVP
jgi:HAD superfamily hydrolase (TIGR01490 family)